MMGTNYIVWPMRQRCPRQLEAGEPMGPSLLKAYPPTYLKLLRFYNIITSIYMYLLD